MSDGRVISLLVAAVLVTVSLAGCGAPADAEGEAPGPIAEPAQADGDAIASLLDVDTTVVPDGITVDQMITIEEVREIIGMPEVFFAVPAG